MRKLFDSKKQFLELIDQVYIDYPDRINKYHDYERPHFCVETKDFNVIHLDSTLTYSADKERDFVIGTYSLMQALDCINPKKPSILITHYSFDYLRRDEQKQVLYLLMDNNVQMWFAGHEHDEIIRKQRDYFFEFQCGNLIHEKESKSCIIFGEYDSNSFEGMVKALTWQSPEGWRLDPYISIQKESSKYSFTLDDNEERKTQISKLANEKALLLTEGIEYSLTNSDRIYSDEDDASVVTDNETVDIYLNDEIEKLGVKYDGFLYLNNSIIPFCKVNIGITDIYNMQFYFIRSQAFTIELKVIGSQLIQQSFGYNLSEFSDVDRRLLEFSQIKEFLDSNSVFLKVVDNERYNFSFKTALPTEEWDKTLAETDYWINQMERISKIEKFYNIKFGLPVKATEEEFLAIEVLSDSIDLKPSRTLPSLKTKKPGLRKTFVLNEDILINNGTELPTLHLFGYSFMPIAEYLLAGTYKWDRRSKSWNKSNAQGLPLRVEFIMSLKEDINLNLVETIPMNKFEDIDDVIYIEGEGAKVFDRYVKITHDFMEIWQLFLLYQNNVQRVYEYDVIDQSGNNVREGHGPIIDKLKINEITNSIVASGEALIKHIDDFMHYLEIEEETYGSMWYGENICVAFLQIMRAYSNSGHFPVRVDANGFCYYDIKSLINEDSGEFYDTIVLFESVFNEEGNGIVDHYTVMRNYLYSIAAKLFKYFTDIKPYLFDIEEDALKIISDNPNIIIKSGSLNNYVGYCLEGEDTIHVFNKESGMKSEYVKCINEVRKNFELCSIGRQDV